MTLESMFTSDMRLSDVLRLSMQKSVFDKTPYIFLPQGALDSIITEATILIAMGITQPTPEDCKLAAYIFTKAKRIFCTAAYIELRPKTLYRAMVLFRDTNFTDENLPLEVMSGENLLRDVTSGLKHPLAKLEGHVDYGVERIWTFRSVHAFLEEQFKFLAPIISIGKPDHDFGNLILPFVKKHAAQAEGSFGVISKYEIHSDHVKFWKGQNIIPSNICAVKEFKINHGSDHQEVAQRWASEVKALATMNTLNQDHIVRFIAAFCRGAPEAPEHYLVTEWADGGNLHDLWKSIPNPPLTGSFMRASIKQLRGLSDALCAIHNLRGRHGDLKPANILWYGNGDEIGLLKIGDFGEAKSHQIVTAMRNTNTTARYGTRRYEPPECETGIGTTPLGRRDMRRSRLYDIWSFGCITLEFIIWLLHGTTGLREFNESVKTGFGDESPFYQVVQTSKVRSAKVHNVVASWMTHISKDLACRTGTTALGDLLELVERGLLVVKLPSNAGFVLTDNPLLPYNMGTERHVDSDISSHYSLLKNSPSQARSEEIPMIDGTPPSQARFEEFPMINVTPPHREKVNNPRMHLESVMEGPVRYRADELRDRLKLIESRHAKDSYLSTQRKLPLPVVTLDPCSLSTSHSDNKKRPQLTGDYGISNLLHAEAHIEVDRTSAEKVDRDPSEVCLNDQARKARDNDNNKVHFTTRGRPRGSKNKRTTQSTRDSTKISSSTSSSSQPSKPKRPRINWDGDDDQGEQNDEKRALQHRSSNDSLATLNLACPFAKRLPLEYPQCRAAQFRDNAKVKEHLRKHHRIYCVRCGEAFHSTSALKEHLRQTEICTRSILEESFTYMSDEQEVKISVYGISWFGMYKVLFPGFAVPDSSCYEDSEDLVFSLMDLAHGSAGCSLRVFQAYRRNQRAESTCSARAALHDGCTATSTQSGVFQTSDSGYSAPEENPPARSPSTLFAEHPHSVPQEHDSNCATTVHASNTAPKHNADIDEEHMLQGVVEHADSTENMEMQTISDSFDASTIQPLGINNPIDETSTAPIEKDYNDITDYPFGETDLRLPAPALIGDIDWIMPSYNYDNHALDDF